MCRMDWQRMHKTAKIFSCADAEVSEKDFNVIINFRRSMVSVNMVYADFGVSASDSTAIPYSMKERAASKY